MLQKTELYRGNETRSMHVCMHMFVCVYVCVNMHAYVCVYGGYGYIICVFFLGKKILKGKIFVEILFSFFKY